jgi:hypothetical protein
MEYLHVHELWRHWLDQFVHRGCWLLIVEKCLWLLSTCDPFISSFENYIYKLLKILKINLDIVNDVTYIYEKYQCKIICVMGLHKKTNQIYTFCDFCVPRDTNYLKYIICTFVECMINFTRINFRKKLIIVFFHFRKQHDH